MGITFVFIPFLTRSTSPRAGWAGLGKLGFVAIVIIGLKRKLKCLVVLVIYAIRFYMLDEHCTGFLGESQEKKEKLDTDLHGFFRRDNRACPVRLCSGQALSKAEWD